MSTKLIYMGYRR